MPTLTRWVRVGTVSFGKGVFARDAIPAKTIVGTVRGRVIDDPEYASSYAIDLGNNFTMEPHAPFRYLNHCCTPNSRLVLVDQQYEDGTPAPSGVEVETLRPLAPGEELTIDYAWSVEGAIPCLCGSAECRGWVVDAAELEKLPQRRRKPKKETAKPNKPR